jgi:hypothetical protein
VVREVAKAATGWFVAVALSAVAWPVLTATPRWGHLTVTPIVITPPLEYIPTDAGPINPPRWHFAASVAPRFVDVLSAAGLSADDVEELRATARPDPGGGVSVAPDPALLRRLAPDVRARLYAELSTNPLNADQLTAFRFHGSSIDDWLGPDVTPDVRKLLDPLIYRDGDFLFLADLQSLRPQLGNGPVFQRLLKRLLAQATMEISVDVDDPSAIDELAEYWGRGGRKVDIRPVLEAAANNGVSHAVDITYLLPDLPRLLLYHYQKLNLTDLEKSELDNCFWTALNFFNDEPDDRYLDPKFALDHLQQDYYIVQDELQLGDIVALSDQRLNIFHVAVYLAEDLVFTKNGYFNLAPWTIEPMDRLKSHFLEHRDDWRVTYYRRKDQ